MPIRYPLPNKEALLNKIRGSIVFSKHDLNFVLWAY